VSSLIELPAELYDFSRRPAPQSILVRGPPGSGKSTFALALLESYRGRRFYISSRVSRPDLLRDHPWLAKNSGITIVDRASRADSLREAQKVMARAREMIRNPEEEPEFQTLWLPAPIQEVWGETGPTNPGMVVIDSWDALVEKYLGAPRPASEGAPDRAELERLLIEQMARGPIFLVFVLEREEQTQLDYLVDGVLETTWEAHDGRPERWLHLRKLRGTRIEHPSYPYTLEGGKFQCILPLSSRLKLRYSARDPAPEEIPGSLWPGSTEFASAFGRLPVGALSTFERDPATSAAAVRLLVTPMVAEVLAGGGRVVHILPPNILPEEVWQTYQRFVDAKTFVRHVRLQCTAFAREVPPEIAEAIIPAPGPGGPSSSPPIPETVAFLRSSDGGKANLAVIWISGLRALSAMRGTPYTPENLPAIALGYVAGAAVHVLYVGVVGDPLLESLQAIASKRLRLRSRMGRVFVHGEEPATPVYVLSEGDERNAYHLLRLV
jgi:KaiC/GvpD/RAD55 family RecA-like ATPase